MYKTESTLGLVGSVMGAVFTFFCLAGTVMGIVFYNVFEPALHTAYNDWVAVHVAPYGFTYETLTSVILPVVAICSVIALVVAAASVILGFMGTSKLNRDDRNGGVMLIVGGALALISVVGFIPFVLMLVGGIMAMSKRQVSASAAGSAS